MSFRIRPGKDALGIRLHDLESAIMDAVWKRKLVDFAVSDIVSALEGTRDLAYTTAMTTVVRLHDKGLLTRRKDGKRYLYSPRLGRAEFLESTAREVLDRAVGAPRAMAMLAEKVSGASSNELDELEALIRRRREELGA